jgi:hypothetical protein
MSHTRRALRTRCHHGAWRIEEGPRVRLTLLPPYPERPWLPFQEPTLPNERWDTLIGGVLLAVGMLIGLLALMGIARLLIAVLTAFLRWLA